MKRNGAKDNSVPVAQATEFVARLKPVIGEENVTIVVFQEGGHGGGDEFNTPENMDTIFSFLDRHLK